MVIASTAVVEIGYAGDHGPDLLDQDFSLVDEPLCPEEPGGSCK
jgi:hypothetical protein